MEEQLTERLTLAAQFINSTNSPVFLTGKAGTGKTTFLRNLGKLTHKKFVVVAPTGIAALNAKGVTIHSQFLFPLGTFLPTREPEGHFGQQASFYTQFTLGRRHTLNGARRQVLKSIELLIIDEVSMLRADILDAIDYRLKSVKRNFNEPFGGIQILFIGDLFQLPPIVRDEEWAVLGKFYHSMHFFSAKALAQSGMVYLELDKIFRQQDPTFINLLNKLRSNQAEAADITFLNKYYKTAEEIRQIKDSIIITTHNYKADNHNRQELAALHSPAKFFEAEIKGEFPESIYPVNKVLELKEGAQIMFIKNDTSGLQNYFNGKMAKIKTIDEDGIKVVFTDSGIEFQLNHEVWENKRYKVNEETKELEEEIIGTFSQFPIKLAWAVTVHKSQGLTFDKAIIDVGEAFAPGQVYVALSRLRGLEGLVMRTRITPQVMYSDNEAVSFTEAQKSQANLEEILARNQKIYVQKLLSETYAFDAISKQIEDFIRGNESSMEFEDQEMRQAIPELLAEIKGEQDNTRRFQAQLLSLLEKDQERLMERLEKGSKYYQDFLLKCLRMLMKHQAEVALFSKTKSYLAKTEEIEVMLWRKLGEVKKIKGLVPFILNANAGKIQDLQFELADLRLALASEAKEAVKDNPKFAKNVTGRKRKSEGSPKLKRVVGQTYEITYEMSNEGKSLEDIAMERDLALSTIATHLARGIGEGKVDIYNHATEEQIKAVKILIDKFSGNYSDILQAIPDDFPYGIISMVKALEKKELKD